jgi:hypothetical protein
MSVFTNDFGVPSFDSQQLRGISNNSLTRDAIEAYIYGYPQLVMAATQRLMTNYAVPTVDTDQGKLGAPINQFVHAPAFPSPDSRDVVRPNNDTLYSLAWLDLSVEPVILELPEIRDRYYLIPLLDAWTNVFAAYSPRTSEPGQKTVAIVGPNWQATLPASVERVNSPTNTVWILGRTQTNSEADYAAVREIQQQYKLSPLSLWQTGIVPAPGQVDASLDTTLTPDQQVAALDGASFFEQLAELLKKNPPIAGQDDEIVGKLNRLGIIPGQSFNAATASPEVLSAMAAAPEPSLTLIQINAVNLGEQVNNWLAAYDLGVYGDEYLKRATTALVGLGANEAADALYPSTAKDSRADALLGSNFYRLRFPAGESPPVKAFWSVTLYDSDGFFVENPIDRYSLGSRNGLTLNPDGSVDVLLQNPAPAYLQENWLPTPVSEFNLLLRMYYPDNSVLDQTWVPPAIERLPGSDRIYRLFDPVTGERLYVAGEGARDEALTQEDGWRDEGIAWVAAAPVNGSAAVGDELLPVLSFYNPVSGDRVYTADPAEILHIRQNLQKYQEEGVRFSAFGSQANITQDIHRFWNPTTQRHFYTANTTERQAVEQLGDWIYEGIAFEAGQP